MVTRLGLGAGKEDCLMEEYAGAVFRWLSLGGHPDVSTCQVLG